MTPQEQVKAIQVKLGVKSDGVVGPKTIQALYNAIVGPEKAIPVSDGLDERTERNVKTLLPKAQALAHAFLNKAIPEMAKYGITVKIISGNRTYAEQDALYAQGRTKPGPIVTNAKGGYSNHNFGIAFDIGLFKGSDYLEDSPYYETLGPIGESVGLEWGGKWTRIKDYPHYEVPTGLTMEEKRQRVAKGIPIV